MKPAIGHWDLVIQYFPVGQFEIGERKGIPQTGLCQRDQAKEVPHAFKDESYHIEQ